MAKTNKSISNFPNYVIDTDGNVYNKKFNRFLKPQVSNGYRSVCLCKNNKRQYKKVHRLVLETFIDLCPNGFCACHNNGNKLDNRLENLRWDSYSNNHLDKRKHGTDNKGEKCYSAKLKEQDVRMIIYMYRTGLFTQQEIADIYDITHHNVSFIVNKKSWKHIWNKDGCDEVE